MIVPGSLACPSCSGSDLLRIGPLHEVQIFAGKRARERLPASSLYRCHGCELVFRAPVLSAAAYDRLYDNSESSSWMESTDREDWALIVRYLNAKVPQGASILDFGCYAGGLLARIGSGYSRKGVEINASARELASKRTGAEVFGRLDQVPDKEKFDVVTAVDVVEHFPDPAVVIAALLNTLKPGGALIVTTGDAESRFGKIMGARWWYSFFPEHLSFISGSWVHNWLSVADRGAKLELADRFRHVHLSAFRYLSQVVMAICYFLAPRWYLKTLGATKRMLGRDPTVHPPGAGLTRDHIFLVFRRTT